MWGTKLGLREATWMGKSGMGLNMWRMGWQLLSMGWTRKLGCRMRKVRRLEEGLDMGLWGRAGMRMHWRW